MAALRSFADLVHNRDFCSPVLPCSSLITVTAIFPLHNVLPLDSAGESQRWTDSSVSADADGTSDTDLSSIQGGVITIGNFDGVHRGHAELLGHVKRLADQMGGPAIAIVLDPHPATVLRPELAPERLTRIETRAELMDRMGIDALVVCATSRRFLSMSTDQFFDSLVKDRLQAKAIVEGPNFFFGRDRGGDVRVLAELCDAANIKLQIVKSMQVGRQMISSTRIRRLLIEGAVAEAAGLLGYPHRICGTVESGAKRGRQIGFPTANLSEIDVVVPGPGVYAGHVRIADQKHPAAIHIGPNPTFEPDGDSKVEVHVLDYDGDLYDQNVQVEFLHRVRDVAKFDSPDALVTQLQQDIADIRSALSQPFGES